MGGALVGVDAGEVHPQVLELVAGVGEDFEEQKQRGIPLAMQEHQAVAKMKRRQCDPFPVRVPDFRTVRELLSDQRAKHMTTMAPEIAGGIELVRELTRRGWIVSLGHTRADFEILDKALGAGARHMTHFMNAMTPLHHRAPGPIGWGLARDEVTCDFIADGVHLDREMLRLLLKLKNSDRLSLISDAVAAAGMGDGDFEIWGETITVKNGRTANARGSIAGSVITMLDAVRMMLSLGSSEVEVAKMAASNPARLLGIDQECGSIEEGKRADLVALDGEGQVVLTLVGGTIVFDARKE